MSHTSLIHSPIMLMNLSHPLQIILIAMIGLSFGSFATMLLYRFPRNETIMGRSHCPLCTHTLRWYDLIPLLSFLLRGGKCHYCKKPISWRYPFTEAVTVLLLILLIMNVTVASSTEFLLLGIAVYSLMLIAFYDFETQSIPDVFVMLLLLSALAYRAAVSMNGSPLAMRDAFMGAAIPFFFFGGLWLMSNRRWIGSGDILLGIAIGVLLGTKLTLLALFFAYVMGACVAIILIMCRLAGRGSTMAFGPFLASGALLSLITGEAFLQRYEVLLRIHSL
jgi:leader peptidase (prepilin peptidase) / N-methyltransferase